ncbi:hypothetical protein EMIT0P265_190011 [Pseudomonas zeae]
MSYVHNGSADVVLSASPFGILSSDFLHEAIDVILSNSATRGVACLELTTGVSATPGLVMCGFYCLAE